MTKKKQDSTSIADPFAGREAENYENPIPSREYILEYMEKTGEPVSYPMLCEHLKLESYEQTEALRRRLIAMARDGQLISNRRGVYGLVNRMELTKGRVQGNKDGYGFFIPVDGSGDLVLPSTEMQKVFDGDIVLARVSGVDRRGRKEGMIVEVLERRCKQIVGRYYWEQGFGVVVPDNKRISQEIMIPEKENRGAQDGQFVVAEISAYPTQRRKAVGSVVEILGDHMKPGMEIDVAVRSHDIPYKWPREVLDEVKRFSPDVPESESAQRIDLRHLPFVTIDGEDAKDFDDAVYCEQEAGGACRLYVAIADVSHYVAVKSALDQEAQNRGNSVYFPGHVIPMLPEMLSNGLCSLKPDVDRLVMVCEMQMSKAGQVVDYTFYEGVIHSHARMTYTEVSDILEEPQTAIQEKSRARLRKKYDAILPALESLYVIYKKLAKLRQQAGALDFISTETRIVFGETRKIAEIVPVARNEAHRLIEECMLAANVCTAQFLAKSSLPVLYRVHDGPNMDRLENLKAFLKEMGIVLTRSAKPEPKDYQRVLLKIADRPDAHLIQTVLIRSLLQAVYQPENLGHFGLGFAAYTHFTSPIRRYPDLLVHRALRFLIRSKDQAAHVRKVTGVKSLTRKEIYPYELNHMQSFGEACSMMERRADAASYDVIDWLKCEYIKDRVGDEFPGTVSSVTAFGLFVELRDIYVEGLVHITALKNDYYQFDPVRHLLRGERSGVTYHLGDPVRVKVVRVDLDDRKIDLVMMDGSADKPEGGRGQPEGRNQKGSYKKDSGKKNSGKKGHGSKTSDKPANAADKGRKGQGQSKSTSGPGKPAAAKVAGKSKGKRTAVAKPAEGMSLRQQVASGLVTAPTAGSAPKEVRVSGRRRTAKKPKP
ncbi:MAG: ribonuclease R [Gammaproteobacteria bacterium]|nr:ribonuclease R [Gammaproteobacteria bacterium]MDP2348359.1 ribonuclease R [Gammaproteobacteria bacterium]